jgi:hypothetical protein
MLAIVCVTLAAAVAAPQSAAYAAPPCNGNSCDGLDPDTTRCNEGGSIRTKFSQTTSTSHGSYTYQLRRSGYCNAFWARFIRDDCGYVVHVFYWLRVQTQLWTPYGWAAHKTHTDGMSNETDPCTDSTGWTVMAPGQEGTRGRVCWGVAYTPDARPSSWGCSGWYNGGNP